jgi:HEAT repeat protein
MRSVVRSSCGCRLLARHRVGTACVILFVLFGRLALPPAFGDGCFVFRWNKGIDINEPTQKAIIVYDAGREDLLLQVKYEGPLEEFGWLIPVPSLPTVEKGSMQPFYELSQLTQQQWQGIRHAGIPPSGTQGAEQEAVKVIQVKTVGAYKVAVLSARDAGSLERWHKSHGYSIPAGKAGIIDDYIRKGWYFVAAKISLSEPVAAGRSPGAAAKKTKSTAHPRKAIQKQLTSGELHPLLISFDVPKCIYPLSISAVSGKPSEVSLYILSNEALLDKYIFDKAGEKLDQRMAEWEQGKPERAKARQVCERNVRVMMLSLNLYNYSARPEWNARRDRDWSLEDLTAIYEEGRAPASPVDLYDEFYAAPYELLQSLPVTPSQLTQCVRELPRLRAKTWYLTKQVWTFRPEEMHDLEFQPAIPLLKATLPSRVGGLAATLLTHLDPRLTPFLVAACQSTNARQRINASSALQAVKDPRLVQPLLALLKDEVPQVRLNTASAAGMNWDPRFIEPLVGLLRDRQPEIRQQAVNCLERHESTNRVPAYIKLLQDPDPDVQVCALRVLTHIGRDSIPRVQLLRLLGSSRLDNVYAALALLSPSRSPGIFDGPPIRDPRFPARIETNQVSSIEAAPLMTNRLTMARVMGLKVLRQNADAQAVELSLPLLRDTNSIVRNRAFTVLQTLTGQNIPQIDPAKWEQWWVANKDTFVARKPDR